MGDNPWVLLPPYYVGLSGFAVGSGLEDFLLWVVLGRETQNNAPVDTYSFYSLLL